MHVHACKPAMNCRCKYHCKIYSWMFLQYTIWSRYYSVRSVICWAYWTQMSMLKNWHFIFMKSLWKGLMFWYSWCIVLAAGYLVCMFVLDC